MIFTCFANLDNMVKQYAETEKKTVQNIKEKTGRIFPKLLGRLESNIVLTLGTVQKLEFFMNFPYCIMLDKWGYLIFLYKKVELFMEERLSLFII